MAERVAVFAGPAVRRNLKDGAAAGLELDFFPPLGGRGGLDLRGYGSALVELASGIGAPQLRSLRTALPGKPLGSLSARPDGAVLRRSAELGFDFHQCLRPKGSSTEVELLARLQAARALQRGGQRRRRTQDALKTTAQRLEILTEIVKTANSILEPRRVIDTIMARIQQLIPSEAWSMLMVDEQRQELTFELALGDKGKDVSPMRVKIGEGIAGWVALTGEATIVNDTSKDARFANKFDSQTQFRTKSILAAPMISRGRTIGVVEIINARAGRFTNQDMELLLTLVEPCAIAIENAMLFQRAEQLTITDDLTQLFNSRYLNLYMGRELKRCKRHGIPLSVIFLDLDGFKGINDQHGHLAGSRTLTEVGGILGHAVRESDILARYGGDEFVVVLPETPPSGALVIAERIRKAIEAHPFLAEDGLNAHISASLGVASYPENGLSPEALIQKADQAMYRVKDRNKNGIEVAV